MMYRHRILGENWPADDKLRGRIPVDQCKTRRLYRVDTRNFGPVAVFDKETNNGFYGVRRKFGIRLDVEYHFQNEAFNTASPWEELPEELPADIELVLSYPTECKNCKVLVEWRSNATGTKDGPAPGKWFHLGETACTECFPVGREYTPLMTWLKAMEEKYGAYPGWVPEWLDPKIKDRPHDW
jgi:hypothetical protein